LKRDPDFITSDVSEESYIKIEVQIQKILEDGKLVLVIDTEAYTQE
jgi:predicted rRNA methylase YqxC with S4 and FtsJ domains